MMTRLQRRVFLRSLAIGGLLTLMVLAASAFGLLDSLEYWLYDQRTIYCQLAEPPPTSQLVHLDIDDASVSPTALGRYPWPRANLAKIIDEIELARPAAVGLDILFSEPQEEVIIKDPATGQLMTRTDDADLVNAIRRCGNAVLAADFKLEAKQDESTGPPKALDAIVSNLEITKDDFEKSFQTSGGKQISGRDLDDLFLRLRRRAMKKRIDL